MEHNPREYVRVRIPPAEPLGCVYTLKHWIAIWTLKEKTTNWDGNIACTHEANAIRQ